MLNTNTNNTLQSHAPPAPPRQPHSGPRNRKPDRHSRSQKSPSMTDRGDEPRSITILLKIYEIPTPRKLPPAPSTMPWMKTKGWSLYSIPKNLRMHSIAVGWSAKCWEWVQKHGRCSSTQNNLRLRSIKAVGREKCWNEGRRMAVTQHSKKFWACTAL